MIAVATFNSCASKKEAAKANEKAIGDIDIELPCEVTNDKNHFRASQMHNSTNLSQSIKVAETKAKQSLAGLIQTTIKDVTEIYSKERNIENASEFNETVDGLTRALIKQTLQELNVVCKKTKQKPDGSYNTFVAFEVEKEVIRNGIDKRISNDAKLRQDYDKMKFTETFNSEMEKLEKEQPWFSLIINNNLNPLWKWVFLFLELKFR